MRCARIGAALRELRPNAERKAQHVLRRIRHDMGALEAVPKSRVGYTDNAMVCIMYVMICASTPY